MKDRWFHWCVIWNTSNEKNHTESAATTRCQLYPIKRGIDCVISLS